MQLDDRRAKRDPVMVVVLAGLFLTLVGAAGDLIWHGMNPGVHPELLKLGSGETPWHIALFGGITVASAGAVIWAARLRGGLGVVLGTGLSLMLLVTVAAGAWSVGRDHPTAGTAALPDDHHATPTPAAGAPDTATEGEGTGHTHGEAGVLTAEEQAAVDAILGDVKVATRRFRDIEVAKEAGFFQVTQFIPGLGLHLFNPKNAGTFDPVKPQILLYMPGKGDTMKLAGVAYSLPKRNEVAPEGFPGTSDVWHYHDNLCFLPGGSVTVTSKEDCTAQRGLFQATTGWLLHAWIYQVNPNGVFTENNPTVA
jgi:hypothetical protein